MKQISRFVAAVAALLLFSSLPAEADPLIAEFSEQTVPTNPMNSYGSFTHGAFSAAGAVTDGPDSLILDVMDDGGDDGAFGGIGVDYGTYNDILQALDPIDFDPDLAYWELRLKVLGNNEATAVRASIRDMDVFGTSGDEHVYEFDLTGVPSDDSFYTLTKDFNDILYTQGAYGFSAGDGINNPGLDQIQIQSVWGATGRLNIEVDYLRILAVPEPASFALLGLVSLGVLFAARRRGV